MGKPQAANLSVGAIHSPLRRTPQREELSRGNSQNRNDSPRVTTPHREEPSRGYSQNRNDSPRIVTPQREEPSRGNSQNRNDSSKSNPNEVRIFSSREGNRRS
jgi:hypothetical protein